MKTISSSLITYRLYHVSISNLWLKRLNTSHSSFRLGRHSFLPRTITTHDQPSFEKTLPTDSALSSISFSKIKSLHFPQLPQTLTEKIVQNHSLGIAKGKVLKSGDYVTIHPKHCMTHDNSWPVALKFMSIGATRIHDPNQIVMTLDHDVQNKSEENLRKYQQIEDFAKKHGTHFYPAGEGIGHQIMVEKGYAWPGTMTVASDSHSNMYGGIGCLGTAIVRTDAASIWATGKTWWQIPPVAKIVFIGILPKGVTGKDVIIALCGLFNNSEVLNHAIEFTGSDETMRSLSVDDRLAIANMTTEWGALTGLFPIDRVLQAWLRAKATTAALFNEGNSTKFTHSKIDKLIQNPLVADKSASYAKTLYLDLSTLSPYVSGPNSVKIATPLRDLEQKNVKLDKAYLVSCTNARSSDFAAAARVFKDASLRQGKPVKISPGVEFYIAAASRSEQELAKETGDWQTLLKAGAKPLLSGCGPCIGLGVGLLKPGEIGISASNRNFKGRMGSTDAKAYLASPEVVAASALHGRICGPGWYEKPIGVEKVIMGEGHGNLEEDKASSINDALTKFLADAESIVTTAEKEILNLKTETESRLSSEEIPKQALSIFPDRIEGDILFCDADNINTDGIYPGKYTYRDNMSPEEMAEACMENYDPNFGSIVEKGDILVSGFNFGCGSSREQAATAILANKIPLIICGSLGNIFARNCINNGLMAIESERLVRKLRECYGQGKEKDLTRRTGWKICWDVTQSKITVFEGEEKSWTQSVGELSPSVREIITCGGLEKWVKSML